MAESEFSWLKTTSFLGATFLVVVCFIMLGFGISTINSGSAFYGITCIVASVISGWCAVLVYKSYQKKSLENRAGNRKK